MADSPPSAARLPVVQPKRSPTCVVAAGSGPVTTDGGRADLVVAGMNVVGLAFSAAGDMIVATNEAVYRLPLGIYGTLL